MSFQRVPGLFRIPNVPGFTPPDVIWRGKGADEGFFAFSAGYSWGGHVIVRSNNLCPCLQIDGAKYTPVFTDINGYIYWQGSGYVYYTKTYGWVLCDKFPGYEPLENHKWKDESYEWEGDSFLTLQPASERA